MKFGRFFLPAIIAVLAAFSIWQISTPRMASWIFENPYHTKQVEKERQTENCSKYFAVSPLVVSLSGKALVFQKNNYTSRVVSAAKQALSDSPVFIDGIAEERFGNHLTLVRTTPPGDAFTITVTTQDIHEDTKRKEDRTRRRASKIGPIFMVTVADPAGNEVGRWQGLTSTSCSRSSEHVSLAAFFASQRTDSGYQLQRHRGRNAHARNLSIEILSLKVDYVARPEDFSVPMSMHNCPASVFQEDGKTNQTLQVATTAGTLWFRYVKQNQTLPIVACNDRFTAIAFRTGTHVSTLVLDQNQAVIGSGRVHLPQLSDREVFREIEIAPNGKIQVVLGIFEVDGSGRLTATNGRKIVATLKEVPGTVAASAETLNLTTHSSCATPSPLETSVPVHEMSGIKVAYEYVQLENEAPVPLINIVVDAPLQSVAISFQKNYMEHVWLIQATPGTNVAYIELAGSAPQTVLLKNLETVVNVATDRQCPIMFGANSATRSQFNIRRAYRGEKQQEVIGHVILSNGHPFVSYEGTMSALRAGGYRHVASLQHYFAQLKANGSLRDATPEDIQRFRDYYFESMPLSRKIRSFFSDDPGLDISSAFRSLEPMLIQQAFLLPKHPTTIVRDQLFLIDKNGPYPEGDLEDYLILDANTLTCPGQTSRCPWAEDPIR